MERLDEAEKKLEALSPKKEESLVEFQGRAEKVLSKYSVEESICVEVKETIGVEKSIKNAVVQGQTVLTTWLKSDSWN